MRLARGTKSEDAPASSRGFMSRTSEKVERLLRSASGDKKDFFNGLPSIKLF